jgi:putative copper export protein
MTDDNSQVLSQAVHDLGAALWFGGSVMGVAGVNKSGNDLHDGMDKIRVAASAWNRFAPAQWLGIAAVLVAGTQLTRGSKGRLAVQQPFSSAGTAKAAIAVAGAAATAFAAYSGQKVGKLAEQAQHRGEPVDVQDATIPTEKTPAELAAWQRRQRVAQYLVPVLSGANVVLGSYLVQQYRPTAAARGLVRRLMPTR